MLAFRTLAAERRPSRRVKLVSPDDVDSTTAPLSRVTVIGTQRFSDDGAAREWLERARGGDSADEIDRALRCVNRAVQGHRIAAHDPYACEVSREQAHRVRIGYGTGDELVEGGFEEAFLVPVAARKSRRRPALGPQEELAGILGGRRPPWLSEDLVLRARLDLCEHRPEQAALQAQIALRSLAAELDGDERVPAQALEWVREREELSARLSAAALCRDLPEQEAADLDDLVAGMERIVRRRRLSAAG